VVEEGAPKLPSVGDVVGGKYRVDRVIGRGGMGTVLAVRHLGLDEARALKLMLPRGLELPQSRERFFREARAAAKLRSENAVAVHDVGVLPDGFPYIEMELLEGADLAQMLKRNPSIPYASAVEWIAQACDAVGEAHAHGIVHRDLKPGNLFLCRTPSGRELVKVLDFGIAKTASADTDPTLTGTNASFGSPMYMSPEQMRGARFADPRSDIWGLGVVLFELLTGKRPFAAESVTALALVVTGDPAPHPRSMRADIPAEVDAVVMRCLEKQPDKRFASAGDLAVALRAAIGLTPPPPRGSLASLPLLPRAPSVAGTPIPSIPIPVAPGSQPSQPSQLSVPSQPSLLSHSQLSHPSLSRPSPPQAPPPQASPPVAEPPQPPRPPLPSDPTNVVSPPHAPHPYQAPAPSSPNFGPPRTPAPTTPLPPNLSPTSYVTSGSSPMTSSRPSVATLPENAVPPARPRPAFLAAAAVLAGALGLVIALIAWRATSTSGAAASASSSSTPLAADAASSPRPIEATPPAVVDDVQPAAPTETSAALAASSVAPAAASAPVVGPSASASARPSASGSNRPGKLPSRPKTGFGGID
jgi:serine/threonine protein kinase